MKTYSQFLLLLLLAVFPLNAQTIAEKKASLQGGSTLDPLPSALGDLQSVNQELEEKREEMHEWMTLLKTKHANGESTSSLEVPLVKLRSLQSEIHELEQLWRNESAAFLQGESYALWNQPQTTIEKLILDYGAPDYVYLFPPEVGKVELSVHSHLPIPHEAWDEMLLLILEKNGIGMRQLTPFLRELYLLKEEKQMLDAVISRASELVHLPPKSRVCFVLAPTEPDPRVALSFLQKFSSSDATHLELIGGKIVIIAGKETIEELLKLYSFIQEGSALQEYRLVHLRRLQAEEMQAILATAFPLDGESISPLQSLSLTSMSQALFLHGPKEMITEAVKLIESVEESISDPQEKTIFWYTVKHSDPEELASLLSRVYEVLISGGTTSEALQAVTNDGDSNLLVDPSPISPSTSSSSKQHQNKGPFVVDPKSGALIMVVEQAILPKLQELLKRIDLPKRMVQLEVLLFEKKIRNRNQSGLNLLRFGQAAENIASWGAGWQAAGGGILDFLISHKRGSGIPAYDLAYNFLLGQQDVQINASPSVVTMNQTPATIAIVDEISINTSEETKKNHPKSTFERKQFGITIKITPTINEGDEEMFVTLDTDITFDNPPTKSEDGRPTVARRHINNHVRIADGKTLILGGLRRKSHEDNKESIPFLGEIPYVGKLFSSTKMNDDQTEMFVFITPKILRDPSEKSKEIIKEQLQRRPGDLPEFLASVEEASSRKRNRLFHQSMTALFGRDRAQTTPLESREYDGR